MKQIQIKMRDLSWPQVAFHFLNAPNNAEEVWETMIRNKTLRITGNKRAYILRNVDGTPIDVIGYETDLSISGQDFWACEICAEIGD